METIVGTNLDETLVGTDESDLIQGGFGNDTLVGGPGDDRLEGEDGNDQFFGNEGNDTLIGGAGDDDFFGGAGDDVIEGGTGGDIFNGGAGADTMSGGEGRDVFYNVTAGDVIDGGEGGDDFDRINLDAIVNAGLGFTIVRDADNFENGEILLTDADGNDAGRIIFSNIEKVVPCFTPGTRIATPRGEVDVQDLAVGDRIITRDNGLQTIRWIGRRDLDGAALDGDAHLRPIHIAKGALGNDLPERDMMVSPNHRMLVANEKTALYFEDSEVLVAAKHLTGLSGVSVAAPAPVSYIHMLFDRHEVILSNGTWSESFQPGAQSLAGIGNAQRMEIFDLFPELATQPGVDGYASARRSIKAHEAAILVK